MNAHSSHPPRLVLAEYLVALGDARLCSVQRPPQRPSTAQVRVRHLRLSHPALTAPTFHSYTHSYTHSYAHSYTHSYACTHPPHS